MNRQTMMICPIAKAVGTANCEEEIKVKGASLPPLPDTLQKHSNGPKIANFFGPFVFTIFEKKNQHRMNYLLSDLEPFDRNPRTITPEKMEDLKKSIKDFPEMMTLKPMIVTAAKGRNKKGKFAVLAGNKRLQALIQLGYTEIPADWVKIAQGLSKAQIDELVIKDNTHYGEWDWGVYFENWGDADHTSWGLQVPEWVKFDPELNPETDRKKLAADDMNAKAAKGKISTDLHVTCPNCAHDFQIKKG